MKTAKKMARELGGFVARNKRVIVRTVVVGTAVGFGVHHAMAQSPVYGSAEADAMVDGISAGYTVWKGIKWPVIGVGVVVAVLGAFRRR
jgi:hypothetical protein